MFVLVRHLTGSVGAALVAAAVFTMAPYRIEHFMHLELQWTMWMPLTFWAVHRAIDEAPGGGVLAGVFLWLQIISCVYYGVFLAIDDRVRGADAGEGPVQRERRCRASSWARLLRSC